MEQIDRIAIGFMEAKILLAAAELRVFERLKGRGASLDDLLAATGWDRRATEILLDALVAMELLEKRESGYRNRPDVERDLVEDAAHQLPSMLRHRNGMFRQWALLEDRVRGTIPVGERVQRQSDAANENFIRAMFFASGETAASVVERIPLDGVKRVADLGGGPGHYLAAFAKRSSEIEPYLVDLPHTLEIARDLLKGGGLADRVRFVAWDLYADDPPTDLPPLDLAFLSQVVHGESADANRALFAKLARVIAPGGRLVVHENLVNPDRTSPRPAAIFAVNMLAMTPGGRTYTEDEIAGWGRETGFEHEGGERVGERSYLVTLKRRAS
jgi:SAM-dependent methyltransferase